MSNLINNNLIVKPLDLHFHNLVLKITKMLRAKVGIFNDNQFVFAGISALATLNNLKQEYLDDGGNHTDVLDNCDYMIDGIKKILDKYEKA